MRSEPTVLLTNDDGIKSPRIQLLYDQLTTIANVTLVSPAADQSAIGRKISERIRVSTHDSGYVVEGTPTDCVLIGLHELNINPDYIISGCNIGPNLGTYGFGRSGTLGAAIEAAYHNIPGIAVSLYVPYHSFSENVSQSKFVEAATAVTFLIEQTMDSELFSDIDYLNINTPVGSGYSCNMELTQPAKMRDISITRDDRHFRIHDHSWRQMDQSEKSEVGTDHWAVRNGHISVTPLQLPCVCRQSEKLSPIIDKYRNKSK